MSSTAPSLSSFPTVAVVTAVEADHLDTYGSLESLESAFQAFVGKLPEDGTLATHADSAACRRIAVPAERRLRTWSLRGNADWVCTELTPRKGNGFIATIESASGERHQLSLKVPGIHNVLNAFGLHNCARCSWRARRLCCIGPQLLSRRAAPLRITRKSGQCYCSR